MRAAPPPAIVVTPPVIPATVATPVIVAALSLPGRGTGQASQPQASGEQRRAQPDHVTSSLRLLRIRTNLVIDHPRLLNFRERAVPIPPGWFGIYPYNQRS